MKPVEVLVFFVIVIIGAEQTFGQAHQQSFDMRIPYTPDYVIIDGKKSVYYELHLTNFTSDSTDLKSLAVFDASDSTVFLSLSKDDLKKRLGRIGVSEKSKGNVVPAGVSSVIYLEFELRPHNPKTQIVHRLEFDVLRLKGLNESGFVEGATLQISNTFPVVLGSPLNNGPWAAVYEPSWERGHRRVIYTVNGKALIPGRFAIDFIKLDNQGRYVNGDDNVIKNWYGYGNDVLAVADGIIASTRDDFSESSTLSGHPQYTADKATGNYISLDIGNNCFAFYEHLKPGSILVKPGQIIKKGEMIASIGFTGQTTGPHLHFHIADGNSALGAEGIPFVFEHFTLLGAYPDFNNFGRAPWIPVKGSDKSIVTKERPGQNSVIEF